jgi:hypothetical protein
MKDSLQQIKKGAETAGKSTPDFPGSWREKKRGPWMQDKPLLSQEKYQRGPPSVLILGKPIRNCGRRICSSSRQSWWKAVQWWKRILYQWAGGILGISHTKTRIKRWNNQPETSPVSRRICLEIQSSQQVW